MVLKKNLEESLNQPGNNDEVLMVMKRDGIPLTRENYIDFIYFGNPPEVLGAEEEAELPEMFQNK